MPCLGSAFFSSGSVSRGDLLGFLANFGIRPVSFLSKLRAQIDTIKARAADSIHHDQMDDQNKKGK